MCQLDFELFSFNVRGILGKVKRTIIFNHLKNKSKKGIFLLQETHSCKEIESVWKDEWGGEIFFSHGTTDSCGVAILISPGLDIKYNEESTSSGQISIPNSK